MRRCGFLLFAAAVAFPAASQTRAHGSPIGTGAVNHDFDITLVQGSLYNPWTLSDAPDEPRSYPRLGIRDGDFIAPRIRVTPGQTLRIGLNNRLPSWHPDLSQTEHGGDVALR